MSSSAVTQGHCSRCRRVWTLPDAQGVCPWCGKPARCQTTTRARTIKSGRRKARPPEVNHGYDKLEGEWLTRYKVAAQFSHKAKEQDTEDLLHDIICTLADAEQANGAPLTEPQMYRIASYRQAHYWYEHYSLTNGLDCRHCPTAQRHKCKEDYLYPDCPKAIKLESLNKPILDDQGNLTELGELIADDKALDIPQWLEVNEQLLHTPKRALAIANKLLDGETLTHAERTYLWKCRKREQKSLF